MDIIGREKARQGIIVNATAGHRLGGAFIYGQPNIIPVIYDKYSKPSPKSLTNISSIVYNKIPLMRDYN